MIKHIMGEIQFHLMENLTKGVMACNRNRGALLTVACYNTIKKTAI